MIKSTSDNRNSVLKLLKSAKIVFKCDDDKCSVLAIFACLNKKWP